MLPSPARLVRGGQAPDVPLAVFAQAMEEAPPTHSEERLRLKQLSDERASKWPNTLQVGLEVCSRNGI